MSSKKSASILFPEAHASLLRLGSRLRASRIERNLTIRQMAERLLVSINTYRDLEAGKPSASLGTLANALWVLGQLDTFDLVSPTTTLLASRRRAKNLAPLTESDLDF